MLSSAHQLNSALSSSSSMSSLARPRASLLVCPAQLDHELHLQHVQLSSTMSSSFGMLSSARSAQLGLGLLLQHSPLSSTMRSSFGMLSSARSVQLGLELLLQHAQFSSTMSYSVRPKISLYSWFKEY
ncbi:hypothetical protein QL285_076099 [Trifolium repens]|nr:hypothetical protein QL285_076099 [Trifolium repens]